jgi:3D (Asp-Asp-Asp) domain-containing protein
MMRYFYSICFLSFGMGLPLLAKNTGTDNPTPSASSKAGTKNIPSSCVSASSSVAQAKDQNHQKSAVTVTSDISRAAVSSSLASKQESSFSLAKNASRMAYAGDALPARTESSSDRGNSGKRLARVTAYWAGEGDYYTGRCISATGVRLHDGHCAVDPNIIPYGSVVEIAGVGKYLAVDTGSAVISRTAAREGGHTSAERNAIVVDLFFEDRSEGERFAAGDAKYVSISWWTPTSMGMQAKAARSLFAEENWTRIESKQL